MFEEYLSAVDRKAQEICAVSDGIWDHAELPYREKQSAELIASALEKEGFTVERGVAGIPTAFVARYGEGKPAMGILAEYDALSGLSQQAGVAEEKPLPDLDVGHGCGHNLFAGGSFGAALAVKEYLQSGKKGSITLFGCPAEEGGGGKVFMVRAGIFKGIDAVVSWHPAAMYMVRTRPALANVKVTYSFKGLAAHAGAAHRGRSALDAVELMSVGVNYLREHMETTCRIHYAYLDAGGEAPNVVQAHAKVKYMIRALTSREVQELYARVNDVARGAALMTGTTVSWELTNGYSSLVTIPILQKTADEAMHDIPFPVPSEEELAFGKALRETIHMTPEEQASPIYSEGVLPPAPPKVHGGSTDTADVSWNCPTVQMHIGTWCAGTPGHSWQAVAQGKSSYAHKALLFASKAVAGTVLRLMEKPELIEQAWEEHRERTPGGYVCPVPDDVQPPIPQE